jgi:asparagine synthase (glutamine-hydrolysing)
MCGIAGVICLDPHPIEGAVRRAMRAMIHRGPDDEGYEQFPLSSEPGGPACGFGFRRLAIMDLSPLGHQPMINADSGDAIVFNGEIYNFVALREQLQARGCRFRSTGDTEVLLRALSEWGEDALGKLDGMFAIAFFHAATRRVLLARDPLGIKPLYTSRFGKTFVFASEVRALLATGLMPQDLDPAGVATYLAYGAPQDPLTVHRHVRSMPSATCEWVDIAALASPSSPRRFWRFPTPCENITEAAAVQRISTDLRSAVQRQCVSDVPLGVFLSGGIDSATMAALARVRGVAPMTFAVGYEVSGVADETAAAAETAAYLGTRHFQTMVDDDWVMLQVYEWLKAADRPSIDGLNTYIVSSAVKDRGVSVALSGLGADEIFGGYSSFRRIPEFQRLLAMVAWMPASVRRAVAKVAFAPLPAMKRAKAVDLVSRGTSAVELAALGRRLHDDSTIRSLGLNAARLDLSPECLPPEAYTPLEMGCRDSFRAVSEVEASLYMGNTLLRDSDVNSMANSLEIRVPFLGQDVVNYVCGLPGSVRAPRGTSPKHLLRQAMCGELPESVFRRPKTGFSLPFGNWLFGPLRDQCEAAVETLANCAIFDGDAVRRKWREYGSRPQSVHWSRPLSFVVLGSYLNPQRTSGPFAVSHRSA